MRIATRPLRNVNGRKLAGVRTQLSNDALEVNLYQERSGDLLIERTLLQLDRSTKLEEPVSLLFPIHNLKSPDAYFSADQAIAKPFREEVSDFIHRTHEASLNRLGRQNSKSPDPSISCAMKDLHRAPSLKCLVESVKSLLAGLCDGSNFLYVDLTLNDVAEAHPEKIRIVVGCQYQWPIYYVQHKCWLIDPMMMNGINRVAPLSGSQLNLHTPGQKQMATAASTFGFRSIFAVPIHANGHRHGFLIVGSEKDPKIMEPIFNDHLPELASIAHMLMAWTLDRERTVHEAMDEVDRGLLKAVLKELTTREAASLVGVGDEEANRRFRRINMRFAVKSRKQAAMRAVEMGLIERI